MKISAGNPILEKLLEGRYAKDIITTVYGPAGSVKTVLCLFALQKVAESDKKIIDIYTEGMFSPQKFKLL